MENTKQEVTVKQTKSVMAVQTEYISSIEKGLKDIVGTMDKYQTVCGYNVLNAINQELAKKGLNQYSKGVDRESINNAIKFCILYRLNTDNKEVFVIVRNEKRDTVWVKKVECRPQYKGQLKILSTYGDNVKKVYPEWIVREGDEFTYATYKGVDVVPPTWVRKDSLGKVVRVVVPIQYKDGFIDYRIAERESVATNIKAQVKQTLITEDKDKAARILALIKDMTLDQLLSCNEIKEYINETYTGLSSEEMIITKLILNATKRVTINYESALARELLEDTYDNADVYKKSHRAVDLVESNLPAIETESGIIEEITQPVEEEPVEQHYTCTGDIPKEDDDSSDEAPF